MRVEKVVRYALGAVVVAAVLGVAFLGVAWHTPRAAVEELPSQSVAALEVSAPSNRRAATRVVLSAPAVPVEPSPSKKDPELGEFTTDTDLLKARVSQKEPKLAEFDFFREHVLQDSVTREDYRKLLADTTFASQAREDLLRPNGAEPPKEANVKRLMEIDFLRESLRWKENPSRQSIMDEVSRVVSEDSFGAEMPMALKRTISASKMELFEVLAEQDPVRARLLVEAAKGTRLEAMLQHFETRNQQRLAQEALLGLGQQVQSPQ